MSRARVADALHAAWLVLVVLVTLGGLGVVLDFCAAENAARYESAGLPSYAELCAAGYADACPVSESLTRWGLK